MIRALAILLAFQLAGEVGARALDLPLPGPVLGMVLLLVVLRAVPAVADALRPTALGILGHLSLLFVPAGVGIVGHLERLGADGLGLALALVLSTGAAIAAGALAFVAVARPTGDAGDA